MHCEDEPVSLWIYTDDIKLSLGGNSIWRGSIKPSNTKLQNRMHKNSLIKMRVHNNTDVIKTVTVNINYNYSSHGCK